MSMTMDSGRASAAPNSAVSWAAIFAGAVAAAAVSLVLFTLGTGIGLASISPWGNSGAKSTTVGILAILWVLAIHVFAFGLGGYIAGRLRTRWLSVHEDEVYFRDTAHGLLVWCLGTVVSACVAASILSGAVTAVGSTAGSAVGAASSKMSDDNAYFTDMLFRSDTAPQNADAGRAEVGRLFVRSLAGSDLSASDRSYAAGVIARQTGLSPADAEQRLNQTVEQAKTAAKQAADTARKVALYSAMWAFAAMLLGAFSASYMATVGAAERDDRD